MNNVTIDPRLIQIGIQEMPAVIDWIKSVWSKKHPGEPVPSSEEVIALYESGFLSSVAKDEAIKAAHSA